MKPWISIVLPIMETIALFLKIIQYIWMVSYLISSPDYYITHFILCEFQNIYSLNCGISLSETYVPQQRVRTSRTRSNTFRSNVVRPNRFRWICMWLKWVSLKRVSLKREKACKTTTRSWDQNYWCTLWTHTVI